MLAALCAGTTFAPVPHVVAAGFMTQVTDGATTGAPTQAPCLPRTYWPKCWTWPATVTDVIDGDTFKATAVGDGLGEITVRLIGVNTMEMAGRGQPVDACHAREATDFLETLIERAVGKVRLIAQHVVGRGKNGRYLRYLSLYVGGEWVDASSEIIAAGHGLWFPKSGEWVRNGSYVTSMNERARRGGRLWDSDYCKAGPHQRSELELRVQADANGPEDAPVTGEMVQVLNRNRRVDVDLGGWWIRDSSNKRYTFPRNTVLRHGTRLNVGIGSRSPAEADLIWSPGVTDLFENVGSAAGGDGVYLFDKHGDLRAYSINPCTGPRWHCPNRPGSSRAWSLWARTPSGHPAVLVQNLSTRTLDLDGSYAGYYLENTYSFWDTTYLHPGETMYIELAPRPGMAETRLHRKWYAPGLTPADTHPGSPFCLMTFDNRAAACMAYDMPVPNTG